MNGETTHLRAARWIWPEHKHYDLHNVYAHFRKDFHLNEVPETAVMYITADESYRLWVNGQYVTRGPARGYQHRWPCDETDIAPFLEPGHNWISVEAYNPGVSTYRYISQMSAGMICAVDLGSFVLCTDATWQSRTDKAHLRDTALYSRQLNFQEHVQVAEDDRKWITGNQPVVWQRPEETVYGAMPWHSTEPRGIPQLREIMRYPVRMVSRGGGLVVDGAHPRNIVSSLSPSVQKGRWEKEDFLLENGRMLLHTAGPGHFSAVVADMGETVVGPSTIRVQGGKAGDILDIFYCEALEEEGGPVIPYPALCEASMANRLILDGPDTCYDFYQTLGFRYLMFFARETASPLDVQVSVRDTGYPFGETGSFHTSDDEFNAIWQICRRTEQVCAQDAYVDTPWREQAQWWGDARIQFWNTMAIDGDVRLLRRGIRSLAEQKVPNGLTYGHAPTMAHMCVCPDFSLIWILTVFDDYWQTGELTMFREQHQRVREVLNYFRSEAPRQQGLLSHDPRYWLFLDWADMEKEGTPTLYNMWFIYTLECYSQLLSANGDVREASAAVTEAAAHRALTETLLFDTEKNLFCDGLSAEGVPSGKHAVHCQVLAILLGMKPESHASFFELRILPWLRGDDLDEAVPSSYWSSYALTVARMHGYGREALAFIRRQWAPMIPLSTTPEVFETKQVMKTTAETFETQRGFISLSHAWSAHPVFHLMHMLGGVTQLSAGWTQIRFSPVTDTRVESGSVCLPTPLGVVESHWETEGDNVAFRVVLPEGMQAEIALPGYGETVTRDWEGTIAAK